MADPLEDVWMDCTNCGFPTPLLEGTVCDDCQRAIADAKAAARSRAWVELARELCRRHLATEGPVCPGFERPPHRVAPEDLTADHVVPVAWGGQSVESNAVVSCRSCNSARGAARVAGRERRHQPSRYLRRGESLGYRVV